MAVFTIDGVPIKEPSTYDIEYSDLDSENSYTSETGILNRDMVRSNQHTIPASWTRLTNDELKSILHAVSGKSEFILKYFDFYDMDYKTGRFYASNRKCKGKLVRKNGGYFSISFDFIEF